MRTRREEITPASPSEFDSEIEWRAFHVDEVKAELTLLARAFGRLPNTRPDVDEADWERWMRVASDELPPEANDPSSEIVEALRERLGAASSTAIRWRVAQAQKALRHGMSMYVEGAGTTRALLLPAGFALRFLHLVGDGELPLAWIGRLDVLRF